MFDEDQAIDYIRKGFPAADLNEDDILFVIDCIWDFYDENGMLEITDTGEDAETDIESLLTYVKKAVRKDGQISLDYETLRQIIIKELEYEKSVEEDF